MNWVLAGQTNMLGRRFATGLVLRPPVAVTPPVFTPASLFAAGEQGVWYDPSDLTTMFEDSAGTTAVHIPGNGTADSPVGKILDKSGRGNHATQSTSTARPTLSALYNLVQYSEQFDNAYWTKQGCTISANTTETTDPLGGNTADKLVETTANSEHRVYPNYFTIGLNKTITFSVALKAAERTWAVLNFPWTNNRYVYFNLANGTIGTTNAAIMASITSLGNSWYRCTATTTLTEDNSIYCTIGVASADNTPSYTGDSTKGIYVWGSDLRLSNDGVGLPAYQRVVDANTYDSTGFPYYLKADGVDDSEATSAIDFTGTNKITVFAGIRKLSDSAQAAVAELSATIASNNGTFLLSAPNSAAANLNFSSKGTTQVDNTVTTYTSPITNVITGIGDISAPNNQIRVNGSVAGTQTGSQGTGNYGNFALYLFSRNSASLRFNGRTYGLIVRGASSTVTEISNTETWLNGKTKAY